MYNVSLPVQFVYGWSDVGGEEGNGKKGSELHGGWKRTEIAWPLVYR